MKILPARLNDKPHYVFHPASAARRVLHRVLAESRDGRTRVVQLPWGLPLEIRTSDAIGYSIYAARVFDPCVTETLHRLIGPGDVVVDAGANIGYMTSLAAVRSGPSGTVVAYEPHPVVFALLAANAAAWRRRGSVAEVDLREEALSDREGQGELDAGPAFEANMGLSSVQAGSGASGDSTIPIGLVRLDEAFRDRRVDVLKIDVEGHESSVLEGAKAMLHEGKVRDIVFEDHAQYPSPATQLVEAAGYHLVTLDNDLFGLTLGVPAERGAMRAWPGPSYLATRDPDRAIPLLSAPGWEVRGIGPPAGWVRKFRGT